MARVFHLRGVQENDDRTESEEVVITFHRIERDEVAIWVEPVSRDSELEKTKLSMNLIDLIDNLRTFDWG